MKKKNYIILGILMTLMLSIGVSYAWFSGRITGEGANIALKAKDYSIVFTDSPDFKPTAIIPGWSTSKTFSVENKSNKSFNYNITMNDLINTFVTEGYLQYKISCTSCAEENDYSMKEYKDIPKSNEDNKGVLAYDIDIEPEEKHEYTIEFRYRNDDNYD